MWNGMPHFPLNSLKSRHSKGVKEGGNLERYCIQILGHLRGENLEISDDYLLIVSVTI